MITTKAIAKDLIFGIVDINDLIKDIEFLEEIETSLTNLSKEKMFSNVMIDRARQQISVLIEEVKEGVG